MNKWRKAMNAEQIEAHVRNGGWLTNQNANTLLSEIERLHMEIANVEAMLDRFFHNAPIRADGLIEPTKTGVHYWSKLSEWTYRNGKITSVSAPPSEGSEKS